MAMRPRERLLLKEIPKEAIRKELERWSDRLSTWDQFFTAVVVGGLAIEYLPDAASFLGMFSHAVFVVLYAHNNPLHQFGGLIVIVGIMGEFCVASQERKVESDLRDENNSTITSLHDRATKAELELAKIREPRVAFFSIKKFSESLKSKPQGTAEVMYQPDDGEAMMFAFALNSALVLGGWSLLAAVRPIPLDAAMGAKSAPIPFLLTLPPSVRVGGQPNGVSLIANTAIPANEPLAGLRETFLSCDLSVGLGLDSDLPDGLVRVVVGPKP